MSDREFLLTMPDDELLAAIRHQVCPACGGGPFRNLGLHIWRAHGVRAGELKEAHGLNRTQSTASREFAETQSGSQRQLMSSDPEITELRLRGLRRGRGRNHTPRRRQGRAATSAAMHRRWESAPTEQRREWIMRRVDASVASRRANPEYCKAASERLTDALKQYRADEQWLNSKLRAVPSHEWPRVVAMLDAGLSQREAAREFGCSQSTISRIAIGLREATP